MRNGSIVAEAGSGRSGGTIRCSGIARPLGSSLTCFERWTRPRCGWYAAQTLKIRHIQLTLKLAGRTTPFCNELCTLLIPFYKTVVVSVGNTRVGLQHNLPTPPPNELSTLLTIPPEVVSSLLANATLFF